MTRFMSTSRTVVSALPALVLAAALPQAAMAANSDGMWKINPAKSSFSSGSATLTIDRVAQANPGPGAFIVVTKGSVYLVTGATAYDGKGVQQVDDARVATQGRAVLIGRNVHSTDVCGFRCQGGLPEPRLTLTFRPVSGAEHHIGEMIAAEK